MVTLHWADAEVAAAVVWVARRLADWHSATKDFKFACGACLTALPEAKPDERKPWLRLTLTLPDGRRCWQGSSVLTGEMLYFAKADAPRLLGMTIDVMLRELAEAVSDHEESDDAHEGSARSGGEAGFPPERPEGPEGGGRGASIE